MTFAEKLDRAKTGSRAAYESLCLGSVDSLYTAAFIALKNGPDAETAVRSAIDDGYSGITRIKDERHLRSWLVHELTKHIVDKLKENKAEGVTNTASGAFAATEQLPDVERLVFAVSVCFGYGTRELSVLTGMSESAASEKLTSAESRLGPESDRIASAAHKTTAPVLLREKYGVFDESLARLEQEAAPAPQQGPAASAAHDDTPFLQEIPLQAEYSAPDIEASQEMPFLREIEQEVSAPEITTANDDNSGTLEIERPAEDDTDISVFADENEELSAIPAGQSASERFDSNNSGNNKNGPALNAETFIAVVAAEQIKGSEFLRLIGNTRISNNVYREIEQNPRLTKKRLIALLEQSPLNETDYYKLLTAIKHRREVINAKEESRLIHERAGLFDGTQRMHTKRRHVREVPKTALQMAIEVDLPKKEIPLTIDDKRILEDEFEYEIRTPSNEKTQHIRNESIRDERIPIITSNQKTLGAVINEVSHSRDNSDRPEPFHPADMEGIFNSSKDIEAVDPIAAIYAQETGEQVKPKRIEELHNEWISDAKKQEEERARTVDNSTGTQEFDMKPPAPVPSSDTKEFDTPEPFDAGPRLSFSGVSPKHMQEKHIGLYMDSASEMLDNEDEDIQPEFPEQPEIPAPETTEPDDEPEIETIPVSASDDVSVTQIITDYSGKTHGEEKHTALPGVSDVTAILDEIPKSGGYENVTSQDNSVSADKDDGAYSPAAAAARPHEPVPERPAVRAKPEAPADDREGGYSPTVPDEMLGTQEIDVDPEESAVIPAPPVNDNDDEDNGAFTSKKAPRKKEKHSADDDDEDEFGSDNAPEVRFGDSGGEDSYGKDDDDDYDDDDTPHRERYKGNEYFIDDNEYYEGVNRGKLIFCIVCAVLLVAGALSMKYVFNKEPDVKTDPDSGNAAVSDTAEPAVTEKPVEDPTEKPAADDAQILTYLTEFEDSKPEISQLSSVYLRASGEPYAPFLSKNVIRTDDTLYIYNDGKLRAVSLSADEPKLIAETDVLSEVTTEEYVTEFVGFTLCNEKLYAVIQEKTHLPETGYGNVFVITYNKDLTKDGRYYSIYGKFCGMGISGGKLIAVTYMPNSGLHFETGKPGAYPVSSETELNDPTKIIKLNGSESHGYAVIGEVGGKGLTAIAGCMAAYPKFDENGGNITLLAADKEQTFAVEINSSLEAVSAKRYAGCAFSEDCLNGDRFIGADMTGGKASGTVASVGKNALTTGIAGETPFGVAWTDDKKTACVLSSQESGDVMLYGFDMSGETPASASDVTVDSVYSDKLLSANGKLIGIKLEGSEDTARAGFRLSAYDYDGKRTENAYTVITADDSSQNKYIRSPAESDSDAVAVSGTGLIAFPMIYFDGFSEIERVTVFSSTLEQLGEVKLYDEKSSVLYAAFGGDKLFVVTDRHIVTAELSDLSVQKTFDIK